MSDNLVALDHFLTLKDVTRIVGVSGSTIYRWIDAGSFPRPRQLGINCVRWKSTDIKAWQESRPVAGAERELNEAKARG